MNKILLYIGGVFTVLFSLLHLTFFAGWSDEIGLLSSDNRGIVQALNIGSMYFLFYSAIITFIVARKKMPEKTDKLLLSLVAGYYIVRIVVGFPLFGITAGEIIIQIICLLIACCYLVPIMNKNKASGI